MRELQDTDWWKSVLGESFHTAFRKGTGHEAAMSYHTVIGEMPDELWDDVLAYVVWCLSYMGLIEVSDA